MDLWLSYEMPYDKEAERGAVGALLLSPREHAAKLARRAGKGQFLDPGRGWLWERLAWAIRDGADWDHNGDLAWWLTRNRIRERFAEYFQGNALAEMSKCTECFWWNGHYYLDRLLAAAKARARIERATRDLSAALDRADEGRERASKWL